MAGGGLASMAGGRGRYATLKPLRLTVQMPTYGTYSIRGRAGAGEVEAPVETMVSALRRIEFRGALASAQCRGLAWIPPQYRLYISGRKRLVDDEYAWVLIRLEDNRRSLAGFFESGDVEWPVPVRKVAVAELSGERLEALAMRAGGGWLVEAQKAAYEAVLRAYVVDKLGEEVEADE